MTNDEIKALAQKAGVRFFGSWIEGNQQAIYAFAELVVEAIAMEEAVEYYLWPDGTYCERHELDQMTHMSDDFVLVKVTEWDDLGDPLFPGGLR